MNNHVNQNMKHYGLYKRVIKIEDFLGQSVYNDLIQSNALLAKILNESNEYDFTLEWEKQNDCLHLGFYSFKNNEDKDKLFLFNVSAYLLKIHNTITQKMEVIVFYTNLQKDRFLTHNDIGSITCGTEISISAFLKNNSIKKLVIDKLNENVNIMNILNSDYDKLFFMKDGQECFTHYILSHPIIIDYLFDNQIQNGVAQNVNTSLVMDKINYIRGVLNHFYLYFEENHKLSINKEMNFHFNEIKKLNQ